MRLIDADALLDTLGIFNDREHGNINEIETAREIIESGHDRLNARNASLDGCNLTRVCDTGEGRLCENCGVRNMSERLPEWVNTAGKWISAVIMGALTIMALICEIIAYGIRLFMGKDDE